MNMLKIFILTATPKKLQWIFSSNALSLLMCNVQPHCLVTVKKKKKTTTEIHAYEQIPAITAALSMAG